MDPGPVNALPKFQPKAVPVIQLHEVKTRKDSCGFTTALSYFTYDMVATICQFTNKYAAANAAKKPSSYEGWVDVTPEEMYRYFGLLYYMALIPLPRIDLYWSTGPLFLGLWARAFIVSRNRFQQISSFLKVSNFETENKCDKLAKVKFIHDYIRRKCMKLFQPDEHVSIDERMVPNKGRYAFRQYIKDKPTKWGMKLWVIADAATGYTFDYEVYTGKSSTVLSKFGLGYSVVMRLMKSLFGQGYKLFVDNYYTSVQLFIDLLEHNTTACGTILVNRKGIPEIIKGVKAFKGDRGAVRWIRDKNVVFLQWKDNKTVTFLSSMHNSVNKFNFCNRRSKVNGEFRRMRVKRPQLVSDYNQYMSGVDKSDQLIGKYNCIRKTTRYWKTLFYHFLDIARVNSYILFQDWHKRNSTMDDLKRQARYAQLDFTIELIKQLGKITDHSNISLYTRTQQSDHSVDPKWSNVRKNCKRCYRLYKKEMKSMVMCGICGFHFCFNKERNCLSDEHQ